MARIILAYLRDTAYDFSRYLRYSGSFSQTTNDATKLEALLFFYYHKIEKALSLPVVKPLFGLGYIDIILQLIEQWVEKTNACDAVVFRGAIAALESYRQHVGPLLQKERPQTYARLEKLLSLYALPIPDESLGGVSIIHRIPDEYVQHKESFAMLLSQRHSVRTFTEHSVPGDRIWDAVRLAQKTPSVCNRQSWRVHVFTKPEDKARILRHQNGNEGFGHQADRVLLISSDLRCFLTSGERQQAGVDAGMFAMTLVLALQSQGIASCCLNLCLSADQDTDFRAEARMPVWEKPIMLILIGYAPESLHVAISRRKSTDTMLSFH